MRAVTRYQAEDGTEFKTSEEAQKYERLLVLENWYDDNKIYGSYEGCRIDWEDLTDWLLENKEKALELIECLGEVEG